MPAVLRHTQPFRNLVIHIQYMVEKSAFSWCLWTDWLPAVYTCEEDSLSFICRSHLPCVVNHPLFIATRAASVNLEKEDFVNTVNTVAEQAMSNRHYVLTTGPFSSESSSRATDDCSTGLKMTEDRISWSENSGQRWVQIITCYNTTWCTWLK